MCVPAALCDAVSRLNTTGYVMLSDDALPFAYPHTFTGIACRLFKCVCRVIQREFNAFTVTVHVE